MAELQFGWSCRENLSLEAEIQPCCALRSWAHQGASLGPGSSELELEDPQVHELRQSWKWEEQLGFHRSGGMSHGSFPLLFYPSIHPGSVLFLPALRLFQPFPPVVHESRLDERREKGESGEES